MFKAERRLKIAVIWSRFGPYHIARLRGAATAAAASGHTICAIEIACRDAVYEWDVVDKSNGLRHLTLFDGATYHDIPAAAIRRKIATALSEIAPDAVAINGWAVPEARAAMRWCDHGRRASAIVMSETKADDAPRVWWKELVKRRLLAGCGAALVGGAKHADYLVSLGMPRACIQLGYDTVDNHHFATGAAAARADAIGLRARLGLPSRYFLACSRFIVRKNIEGLLEAYAMYRHRAPSEPWGLVIAGSGEAKPAYDTLVRELSIDGVVWPGFVQYDALPVYYGLASAFVHPAHAEAWGLVVNEALASGLPVLVSRRVGAGHELVEEGRSGYSFDPSSPDELADKMTLVSGLDAEQLAQLQCGALKAVAPWAPERFGEGLMAAVKLACGRAVQRGDFDAAHATARVADAQATRGG